MILKALIIVCELLYAPYFLLDYKSLPWVQNLKNLLKNSFSQS